MLQEQTFEFFFPAPMFGACLFPHASLSADKTRHCSLKKKLLNDLLCVYYSSTLWIIFCFVIGWFDLFHF